MNETKSKRPTDQLVGFFNTLPYLLIFCLCIASCKTEKETISSYLRISGQTMGTTYHISYNSMANVVTKQTIDSLLVAINNSLSTYIPESTISQINKNLGDRSQSIEILENGILRSVQKIETPYDPHFVINYNRAEQVYISSGAAFDPTVMPLVNYWGFGYTPKKPVTKVDSARITQILEQVGMDKFELVSDNQTMRIIKPTNGEIDFSGIAKGYAVDQISLIFQQKLIKDFMVEIGGEVYAQGVNKSGNKWTIGLSTPRSDANINHFAQLIELDGHGLASSGNYRIYHVVDQKKYGHEINPRTGYPELNDILGVSVAAEDCMTADAYATAYMILGFETAKLHLKSHPELQACFFVSDPNGVISPHYANGFETFIKNSND